MRKGSMLAGLRPRDDESETELEDDDTDEAPESEPAPKAVPTSRKGVPKPSPAETRALDLQIFSAADLLEVSLGRTPTHAEIVAKAKVPGPTDGARKQRVSVAMRRRAMLAAPAKKPSSGARPHKVQDAPIPAPAQTSGQMLRALVEKRDRLRREVAAFDVVIASLGGDS